MLHVVITTLTKRKQTDEATAEQMTWLCNDPHFLMAPQNVLDFKTNW